MTHDLIFKEIDKNTATAIVIKEHYLHRRCPISWAFGIEYDNKIVGVLTVGKPVAWSAMSGIVGEKYEQFHDPTSRTKDVFELNRLWVDDCMPRNTESRFIGWVLRFLRKARPSLILFSCADGVRNHVGYIYQATNWMYAGTTTRFTDIVVEGFSDYRSVPQELRGGNVYECPVHGKFPTLYTEFGQPKELLCSGEAGIEELIKDGPNSAGYSTTTTVYKNKSCEQLLCDGKLTRLHARSWSILDEVLDPADGTRYKTGRQVRSGKHRYFWLANPKDEMALAWKKQPYPKTSAPQDQNSLVTGVPSSDKTTTA